MTLDELKTGENIIDTTAGKVEDAVSNNPSYYASADDPHFSTNNGVRGNHIPNGDAMVGRTPTVDSLDEAKPITPKITQVQSAPINLNELPTFDPNTLPKRPPTPNEMEEDIMRSLEAAVDREIDSITERMDAVTEMQRQEMIDAMHRQDAINNASIPASMDTFASSEENDPDTVRSFDVEVEEETAVTPSIASDNDNGVAVTTIPKDDAIGTINYPSTKEPIDYSTIPCEEKKPAKDIIPYEEVPDDVLEDDEDGSSTFDLFDTLQADLNVETGAGPETGNNEELPELTDEEIVSNLRTEVKSFTKKAKKKLDLSKFKVADVPISASKAVSFSIEDTNKADWVLPNAQAAITVTGLSGPELIAMDPENSTRNKINTQKDIFSIIYRHIDNPNKGTFEFWMKTTRFSDISHIYFALYMATFHGSNFIHYECPGCGNIFIQDVDFRTLVAFKDDETEGKMRAIVNNHLTKHKPYKVTCYQVSDKYAVDIKEPSLWNTVIELTSLSDTFTEKYEDVLDLMSFINNIYYIDEEHGALIPIDTYPVKDSISRTVANRISAYADVIRQIDSDDFFALRAKIANTISEEGGDLISYKTPECACPRCKRVIPEQKREGSDLLFMRHQLGALGVM